MDTENINYKKIIWGNGIGSNEEIPKIIWTFWDSPKASPLVEICFQKIRNLLPDYSFNVITLKNLDSFLPNFILPRTDISFVNFTDIVRLKLLEKYGGIYLDASVLLTQNLDWIFEIKKNDSADLVGFYSDHFTLDWKFPLLETWFLATSPNNRFITAWANEFEKCYTSENPHHYFDEEKKDPNFLQNIYEELSNYLIAYLAASKIMRNNSNFRISMISANDTGHHYNFGKKKIDIRQYGNFFLKTPTPKTYPKILKFTSGRRSIIDTQILKGLYDSNAFLYNIIGIKNNTTFNLIKNYRYFLFITKNIINQTNFIKK